MVSPSSVTLSPLLCASLVSSGLVELGSVRAAHRRLVRLARWRALSFATGWALLVVAFVSPVATMAEHNLLTVHLVQVTLVMGFAPPLLLLGLPRPMPHMRVPAILGAVGRFTVHPVTAILMVNAVFFGWHVPALYDAALRSPLTYALQQVSLLLVSVAFWWPIVEPVGPSKASMGPLVKLGYILLATIPQTFAGLLFALAHHTFYTGYDTRAVGGMSALTDQQVAGACMALISKLALFGAFSVLMWRLLEPHGADQEPGDGGGPDDGDSPVPVRPSMPGWLRELERGRLGEEPTPVHGLRRRRPEPVGSHR